MPIRIIFLNNLDSFMLETLNEINDGLRASCSSGKKEKGRKKEGERREELKKKQLSST